MVLYIDFKSYNVIFSTLYVWFMRNLYRGLLIDL